MYVDRPEAASDGVARATRLIGELRPRSDDVPASFARIIVGLFPGWFEFTPGQFAVLAWDRGLKLVVSGPEPGVAIFHTSDSRCMSCVYVGEAVEEARMDMHYQPDPEQTERARAIISLALRRLFPERGRAPDPAGVVVPADKVFPPAWNGRVADSTPSAATVPPGMRVGWWRRWIT